MLEKIKKVTNAPNRKQKILCFLSLTPKIAFRQCLMANECNAIIAAFVEFNLFSALCNDLQQDMSNGAAIAVFLASATILSACSMSKIAKIGRF